MAKDVRVVVEITEEMLVELRARAPLCFLCRWIVEDWEQNKKMTGYPLDYGGAPEFPVSGKLKHMQLEKILPMELKT